VHKEFADYIIISYCIAATFNQEIYGGGEKQNPASSRKSTCGSLIVL
jgi:hypothetical protein